MSVKLLKEQYLEFLNLTGGYTGSSESILVKMPHCVGNHMSRLNYVDNKHGGESYDYKRTTMADSIEKNPLIQVRLSLIFPLILVIFAWGLKQIHRKKDSNMLSDKN